MPLLPAVPAQPEGKAPVALFQRSKAMRAALEWRSGSRRRVRHVPTGKSAVSSWRERGAVTRLRAGRNEGAIIELIGAWHLTERRLMGMATLEATRRPAMSRDYGLWLQLIAWIVALILTVFNYFDPNNGIHGSEGAGLVIVSTALGVIASVVLLAGWARPRWFHVLLLVLLLLDVIGTGFAADLLDTLPLLGLMVIALIGWLLHIIIPARRVPA
jgi:hypothetical protein